MNFVQQSDALAAIKKFLTDFLKDNEIEADCFGETAAQIETNWPALLFLDRACTPAEELERIVCP